MYRTWSNSLAYTKPEGRNFEHTLLENSFDISLDAYRLWLSYYLPSADSNLRG